MIKDEYLGQPAELIRVPTSSQSITTGISGGLAAIEIQISSDFVSRTELSIFRGGNPVTTTPLIRETLDFPGRGLGNNDVFRWDLPSSQLYFTEGDVFTFGFQAEEAGQFLAANDGPFDYIGGGLFKNGALSLANEVVAFITYVDPSVVPIPAALPLFGSALGFLGFVGWRKKRLGLN